MTWLKNNFLILIIGILLVVNTLQRCNDKPATQEVRRDTTVSIQYIQQPPVNIPPYQPIIVESRQPAAIPQQYQASQDPNILLKQYIEAINKLLTVNHYKDTTTLKDSSGNYVGTFTNDDQVTGNEITVRKPSYVLSLPITTRTITITERLKPRGQLYVGLGINGSTTNYVSAFEAGLMWKNKKDQLYGVNAGLSTSGGISYGISSYWKIKLKK